MSDNAEMAAAWDGPEGDHWAEHAERYQATTRRYRDALFGAVPLDERSVVLDVGCGAGASTIEAGQIARAGSVLGVDLSSRMLDVGRAAAAELALANVRFEQVDAQVHPFDGAAYDAVISCFGAMFFADPVAAFANMRRACRRGASLTLLAWRDLGRNDWVGAIREALAAGRDLPTPPSGAPGPFSMADPATTVGRLEAGGFSDVELTSIDASVCFGHDADDAYAFVSTLGITRGLTADLEPPRREAALAQLHRTLVDHETTDGVCFAGSAWLVEATSAGED